MLLSSSVTKGHGDLFSNIIMLIFSALSIAGTVGIINNFGQTYLAFILLTLLCYAGAWVFLNMFFESKEKYKPKAKSYSISILVLFFVAGYIFATLG